MVAGKSRDELVIGLVRIGELEMTGEGQAEVDAYFAPCFKFHGPDGGEWDYEGLQAYFRALRAAFDDLGIKRQRVQTVKGFLILPKKSLGPAEILPNWEVTFPLFSGQY